MTAKLTSNSRVEEIVSQQRQIRVLDPSRKWSSAIRNSFLATNVGVEVVLDLAELHATTVESGPAVGVVYMEARVILSAVDLIGQSLTISRLPVFALLDAPDDDLGGILRQLGFSAVICGIADADRVRKLASRYFASLPDSETSIERTVECTLPWNPAS